MRRHRHKRVIINGAGDIWTSAVDKLGFPRTAFSLLDGARSRLPLSPRLNETPKSPEPTSTQPHSLARRCSGSLTARLATQQNLYTHRDCFGDPHPVQPRPGTRAPLTDSARKRDATVGSSTRAVEYHILLICIAMYDWLVKVSSGAGIPVTAVGPFSGWSRRCELSSLGEGWRRCGC